MAKTAKTERRGRIRTFSGRDFYPLDPRPEDISVSDISVALSRECRFTNHCRIPYSVAEHSVRVAKYASETAIADGVEDRGDLGHLELAALLHDASEAYIADIAAPLKRETEYAGYREVEERLQEMIWAKYGAVPTNEERLYIDEADHAVFEMEARGLMVQPFPGVSKDGPKIDRPWTAKRAEKRFLDRFKDLIRWGR